MSSCSLTSHNITFILNILIHVILLLSIISSFYLLYVSKLSSDIYKKELNSLLSENINKLFKDVTNSQKQTIKQYVPSTILDKYIDHYKNTQSECFNMKNNFLKNITIGVIIVLIMVLIFIIIILKISCNACPPIMELLQENIAVFIFVGVIEISFFLFIARYYIPVKPSVMVDSLIKSLKNNL